MIPVCSLPRSMVKIDVATEVEEFCKLHNSKQINFAIILDTYYMCIASDEELTRVLTGLGGGFVENTHTQRVSYRKGK